MVEEMAVGDLPFETALTRLDQIVKEMEDSSLPLQRMLVLFEEGTLLGKHCQELLDRAELRIQQIVQGSDGGLQVRRFEVGSVEHGADPAF